MVCGVDGANRRESAQPVMPELAVVPGDSRMCVSAIFLFVSVAAMKARVPEQPVCR